MARVSCLGDNLFCTLQLRLLRQVLTLELTDFPIVQSLPAVLPRPRFQLGDTVRWAVVSEPDFGQVTGIFYADGSGHQACGIHYLVLLDAQSPSRSVCSRDMAFEADLEPWRPA